MVQRFFCNLPYGVQVSASTNAGSGDFSPVTLVRAFLGIEVYVVVNLLSCGILMCCLQMELAVL